MSSQRKFLRSWNVALLVAAYWVILGAIGGFRRDHLFLGFIILALRYGGARARAAYRFLLPLILTAVIYDSQRFFSHLIRASVRVREPYLFDLRFFGIPTSQGVLTPNEWWQLNTYPALDFLAGLAYLVFIGVFIVSAGYFRFLAPRTEIRERAPAVMWSFFWVNMLGYSTYHWYPAAPPWYVALHGFGPAKLDVPPNPAGCVRFDALFGSQIFSEFYGRSADVFGAIPSLHVAYPLITVYFAWKFGVLRASALGFYCLMCFAAVYLNHHYILDILWGSFYAVTMAIAVDRYFERKLRLSARPKSLELPLSA